MTTISSTVDGCSTRAFRNAVKARIRDPTRPIRLMDFFTKKEREILLYTHIQCDGYDGWIDKIVNQAIRR